MTYQPRLDGLRFIAILFVFIEHFAPPVGRLFKAGYYGVDLFFVLSGFLITTILIQPSAYSFKSNYLKFIGRRTLRIFPIYYLTIAVLWLLQVNIVHQILPWLLTYTYNFAHYKFHLPWSEVSHFWSLAIEEQYYLLWPFFALSLKNRPWWLLATAGSIVAAGYISHNDTYMLDRMASLALGAMGAVLMARKVIHEKLYSSLWLELFFLFLLVVALVFRFPYINRFVLGCCSLFFVLKAVTAGFRLKPIDSFLRNKIIVRIGMIAYGLYVYHIPIAIFSGKLLTHFAYYVGAGHFFDSNYLVTFPLYTLLSLAVALLSYRYIEQPVLRLKDRFFRY